MKKLFSTILFAFMALTMFAQTDNSYRIQIHQKNGSTKSFAVNNVDSVTFKKSTNEVGVDVVVKEVNIEDPNNQYVVLSLTPTDATSKYRLTVVPKSTADSYGVSVEFMQKYFDPDPSLPTLTEGAEEAVLSGFPFQFVPGVYYSVMVLSYNENGEAANAQCYDFQVPEVELVGNPSVDIQLGEITSYSIQVTFVPNEDCVGYYICCFEPGLAEKQFNEFSPLMGFACMGDMIKSFGQIMHEGEYSTTWYDMVPGMDYEIYVQPMDANDNYAPMCIKVAPTPKIGGEGLAEMTIELGDFKNNDNGNGYLQEISFIPNDQTAAHRDIVATKESFDSGVWSEEKLLDYMKHDTNPDYPDFIIDPDWDQYGVHTGDYPVTPGKTYYIYTIGKNANGEYGPHTKKVLEVPSNPNLMPAAKTAKVSIIKEIGASKTYKLGNSKVMKRNLIISK